MKTQSTRRYFIVAAGAVTLALANGRGPASNDTDVIRYGAPRSSLIVSGKFLATFSGGGGSTSTISVQDVFKAPSGLDKPKEVAVYWYTAKHMPSQLLQQNTNVFLFFLKPHGNGGYDDVTDTNHLFIRATDSNLKALRRLEEGK